MEKIITNFVEVIKDLNESSFNVPNKETLLQKVQVEQEEYEDKNEEILKKNDQVILEAENVLVGTKATPPVVILPEETTGMKWRNFKPQSSLKPSYLEKEATHLETIQFTEAFRNYIMDGYSGSPLTLVWQFNFSH